MTQRLVYLVTEDWAFWRHRLPMARAARDAGFEVHVITNISDRAAAIKAEGFELHQVDLRRGSVSPVDTVRPILRVRQCLKEIRPNVIHNVALKPLVIGSVAAWGIDDLSVVNSINGLGSAFISTSIRGHIIRLNLERTLRLLLNRRNARTIVQNPEDLAAVERIGVDPGLLVLVPGSGVDCDKLVPLPEPAPDPIRIAFVGRMLDDKGLRSLIRAQRILRSRGETIELLLAGEPDPENPTSITQGELDVWSKEPGIRWLGHIEHVRDVWEQAHIAVLPSRGEGLPKSLLEAAACGRPLIATDVPGCREIVIQGETGLLVKVSDDIELANAMSQLAHDSIARANMGRAARNLTVTRFSSADIGRQTVAVYRDLLKTGPVAQVLA
jgi:glycosyltransferase involved in cell wall biosynthesis